MDKICVQCPYRENSSLCLDHIARNTQRTHCSKYKEIKGKLNRIKYEKTHDDSDEDDD